MSADKHKARDRALSLLKERYSRQAERKGSGTPYRIGIVINEDGMRFGYAPGMARDDQRIQWMVENGWGKLIRRNRSCIGRNPIRITIFELSDEKFKEIFEDRI